MPNPRTPPQLIGESPAFLHMLDRVSTLAPIDRSLLVIGPRGSGKELVAARLHFLSRRWEAPYVKLNCAAMSEELLDSELFGHEAGAFTGASKRRAGRFELADGGTLFLDEIALASARVQEKLLRVIEYGEFERLGGTDTIHVDVRVIGATHADLPALVADNKFRADLLDRLAFDVVLVPPLSARKADIPALTDHFATRMASELGLPAGPGFAREALETLIAQDWPGNIRSLKNTVERTLARAASREGFSVETPLTELALDPFTAPWDNPYPKGAEPKPASPEGPLDFATLTAAYETELVEAALQAGDGHQGKAAEWLGLSYHQFRGLMKKHGLK